MTPPSGPHHVDLEPAASCGTHHARKPAWPPRSERSERVDLEGRLSNPLEIAETLAAQGLQPVGSIHEGIERQRNEASGDPVDSPREGKGRLSNPPQRRLSPTDIHDLIEAYRAGATINQLAAELGIHRTTVTRHLDRHGIPRHSERTAWDDHNLKEAAEMYVSGLSLSDVARQFNVNAQTVANRFRRAGIAVRPRRGWHPTEG